MDWTLLGIAPTRDRKAITAAYRQKVVSVNPEDKPEEFKALRAAYEEALRLAQQEETAPTADETPVGRWMEKVKAVYGDFRARIRVASWEELLSDEVCVALDQRGNAEEALLRFFMDDYYLPQEVWQYLDTVFSWVSRKAELYEKYPRDFVDYVIVNGALCVENLPYELFTPGQDAAACDQYRTIFYRANRASLEDVDDLLDQLDALPEQHPYGKSIRYRVLNARGDAEGAAAGYQKLAEAYPEDVSLHMLLANQYLQMERWEDAESCCRRVLEMAPENGNAKHTLARCLAHAGNYDKAKEMIYDLMDQAEGDQRRLYELTELLNSWNEAMIRQKKDYLAEHPGDGEAMVALGWCYLQLDRDAEALEVSEQLEEGSVEPYMYYNFCSKANLSNNRFAPALEKFEKLEALLRDLQPDGTEKTEKRIHKLPEILQLEGACLTELQRSDEAMEKYQQSLVLAPEQPEILINMARIYHGKGEYEKAAELLEKVNDLRPNSYHPYFLLADNLFEMGGRDRDAYAAVNRAMELERGDLNVYVLKMEILIANGVWDAVHETLDFLHQNNVGEELPVKWCEAQVTEYEEKDTEKALALYQAAAERVEKGEYLARAASLYFRIVVLLGEKRDMDKEEERNALTELLDKGLKHNPHHYGCRDYKAWLLKRGGKNEEALRLYQELEALPRHNSAVERALAELYYKNLSVNADKALHYYRILQEREPENDVLYFYTGTCRRYLHDYENAERDFLKEQELAPEDIDGYKGLSYVYEYSGQTEKALEQIRKAIPLLEKDTDNTNYHYRAVRMLRRMRRPGEALDALADLKERFPKENVNVTKFDILCQFGLFDKAETHLKEWKKTGVQRDKLAYAEVHLLLLRGETDKAKRSMFLNKHKMSESDSESMQLLIGDLEGDFKTLKQIWEKRLKKNEKDTHALMNMAQVCFLYGKKEDAERYARKALELLDDLAANRESDRALYASRRICVLAVLGRIEEARQTLEEVRQMHLCEGCAYDGCKDAEIFAGFVAEAAGDYALARKLYEEGHRKWPDEDDFLSSLLRLKRRGY